MFSCQSRSACGRVSGRYSDSDEDSSYGFKTAGNCTRTRAAAGRPALSSPAPQSDDEDYHIYGNVTFGYKPILKTRLSSAASSIRRRAPAVKRTVSFSGVESPVVGRRCQAVGPVRPPPPCYSVAVRRASSFSTTRRNAAAEMMLARRRRMPLPDENTTPPPSCNVTRVVVDVHSPSVRTDASSPPSYKPAPVVTNGLDKSPSKPTTPTAVENVTVLKAPNATDIAGQRMDSYRFSMANLEDTQDVDLDAVLGELCALESQYQSTSSLMESEKIDSNSINRMMSNSNQTGTVIRTDSPDNDSAFSDCVSLLSSSESSASSGTTNTSAGNKESSKAEKIRLALQKMKEASVKKLFIKVFNDDGGAKSLLVDEGMRCSYVMRLLADKHHINLGPRWGLVEHLPDLHMERVYEEHELLVDNLMLWTRDSKNRLLFVERPERTLIFENPSLFNANNQHSTTNFAQEYFCNGGLPSVEGPLYIKTDSRKGWKKYYSVLRASGLYYYKDKVSRSPKDLVCLSTLDVNQVYYGVGWKKKYKAPTEYCLAIKHPCLQQPKSTKYIKYVCAEDEQTLHKWMSAIRIVKYGQQLLENYETALVGGDSSSSGGQLSTLHGGVGDPGASGSDIMLEDIESGLSDSGSSSGCDVAFESDYPPCGTIKRKPPKLPLTATTRQLSSVESTSASVIAAVNAAATAANAATTATISTLQKPVKSVKFADHHYGHHHHHNHLHQHHHNNQNQLQHYRTPSLESLPPPPPELLVDDDEPNDQDIMSDVPPPPPKLLSPPSTAFLADLHRVVRKKWQVAQKCKSDTMATPHEVLGFRDPVVQYDANTSSNYSREDNVSNWVAEHYGPNNLYENVYPVNGGGSTSNKSPMMSVTSSSSSPSPPNRLPAVANAVVACTMLKKRPPPPPPPRSEKTQLSTVVL